MRRGGVEHVLGELLAQRGEPLLDPGVAGARLSPEQCAAEAEVAQRVVDDALARRTKPREIGAIVQCPVLAQQSLVLSEPGPELGDAGQHRVVRGAQLGRVRDGVEVADDAPGATQTLGRRLERFDHRLPGRRGAGGGHLLQGLFGFGDQGLDRRLDMAGPHRGVVGQVAEIAQRVVGREVHMRRIGDRINGWMVRWSACVRRIPGY